MTRQSPRDARLELALEGGVPDFPASGPVAVFRPSAEDRLDAIAPERLHVFTGLRPDYDAFAARGHTVGRSPDPEARHEGAIVCAPRVRAQAQGLIAAACACTNGPVLIDGQKTDGIDSLLRACRARMTVSEPIVKAHGRLFAIDAAAGRRALADWELRRQRMADGFTTLPGVFSADGPDPGSMLLAAALPARLPARIADLGAGWGWLSAQVLTRDGIEELHLVEAEADALDCARMNLTDARVRFHWADARTVNLGAPLDAVVMNPPFHPGRSPDPELGRAFVAAAARLLGQQGVLWMVSNRHMPYSEALATHFAQVGELPGSTAAFRLTRAARPRSARAASGAGAPRARPVQREARNR